MQNRADLEKSLSECSSFQSSTDSNQTHFQEARKIQKALHRKPFSRHNPAQCRFAIFCQFERIIVWSQPNSNQTHFQRARKICRFAIFCQFDKIIVRSSPNSNQSNYHCLEKYFIVIWKPFHPIQLECRFAIFCQFDKIVVKSWPNSNQPDFQRKRFHNV